MQIILLKSREKDGYETSLPVCLLPVIVIDVEIDALTNREK